VGNLRRCGWILAGYGANIAVTLYTKLRHTTALEQLWIRRSVGVMTRCAALDFYWGVFKNEWSLFVCMALEAGSISARRKTRLL
jgi:hypothetical protein